MKGPGAKLSSLFLWTSIAETDRSRTPALTFRWDLSTPDPLSPTSARCHLGQAMPSLSIPGVRPWPSRALGDMLLPGSWADWVMEGEPPEKSVARADAGASWGESFRGASHRLRSLHGEFPIPYVNISVCMCVYSWVCISVSLGRKGVEL